MGENLPPLLVVLLLYARRGERMHERIIELITEKKFVLLKEELKEMRAADVAEVFDELDKKEQYYPI